MEYSENKPSKIQLKKLFLRFIPVVDRTGTDLVQVLVNNVIHANKLEIIN